MAARDRDPDAHLRHAFVRDGHLTSLPRRHDMLRAACAYLVERFEPGRRYAEAEVNAVLADDAPDVATLRRLLVDFGYLERAGGRYWREGSAPTGPSGPVRQVRG
jgi:hypothetical protein